MEIDCVRGKWGLECELPIFRMLISVIFSSSINFFVIIKKIYLFRFNNCLPSKFYVLSAGADVNLKNDGGRTALHYAASKGRLKITELLLAHGAKINAKDKACT